MADRQDALIEVEIVYASPLIQDAVTLKVPIGTRVGPAIAMSGVAERHLGSDWHSAAVGIFGKRTSTSAVLHDHDRVEIYRPLIADPKQLRHRRARRREQQVKR
jgi:putative ubiquitin-RnfH superfamily antitoxin RatB of RatAB toxin-antitoxin module